MSDGSNLGLLITGTQVRSLQIALTKVRVASGLSRAQVAEKLGVDKSRVDDFDDLRQPWDTVTVAFLQRYAEAVDCTLMFGVAIKEN